jgi:pimeloyl-ACP methyl ester carboxylesterase
MARVNRWRCRAPALDNRQGSAVSEEGLSVSNGVETRTVSAGSGRELCVEIAGEPDGKPILVEIGEPMSRHLYSGWIADAEAKSIRLISYDRPGYGGSTPRPGHNAASAAHDVLAIAEALGHERLGIWGISGGGPYALGCAALLLRALSCTSPIRTRHAVI